MITCEKWIGNDRNIKNRKIMKENQNQKYFNLLTSVIKKGSQGMEINQNNSEEIQSKSSYENKKNFNCKTVQKKLNMQNIAQIQK